jgi:hypothetical protein
LSHFSTARLTGSSLSTERQPRLSLYLGGRAAEGDAAQGRDQFPRALAELGDVRAPFEMRSRWWSGKANITTFVLEELLGTKLRAPLPAKEGT